MTTVVEREESTTVAVPAAMRALALSMVAPERASADDEEIAVCGARPTWRRLVISVMLAAAIGGALATAATALAYESERPVTVHGRRPAQPVALRVGRAASELRPRSRAPTSWDRSCGAR